MPTWYWTKHGKPEKVDSFSPEFAEWYDDNEHRRVATTYVTDPRNTGGYRVHISTVFLALDHGYGDGPPVLWETMIFGGEHDDEQWRYHSEDAALDGHERAVKLVRDSLKEATDGDS